MSSIAIIGAGPRGVGLLERLAASVSELHPGELDVHLIDPYPAGAGRIWRYAQSPLLAMNSMASDVTMFTDESVVCEGPVLPGPSFWDWARQADPAGLDPELADELRAVTASTFPSRRLQSVYLGWVLERVTAELPAGMRVHVHATRAVGLTEEGPTQLVRLDGEPALRVDAVVLASGHLDATPTEDELALAARARAQGLRYLPPEQTTDTDLSVLAPGETVLVRGTGLAFVDLVVLVFEGRGGRFVDDGADLRYVASGQEPHLVVGSPRGAPYHSKTHYQLLGPRPPLPHFYGPDVVDALIASPEPVRLREQAWPLMAKEIAWGWYHELFHGHPDLVTLPWAEFVARFTPLTWGTSEMDALLALAVPDPGDRIDFDTLDRPFDGLAAPDLAALQPLARERIALDLHRHVDPRHTPYLGAFLAMLTVYGETMRLGGSGALHPVSQAEDLRWWQGFFNGVASGPPGFRVRQLLALSRAGLVDFMGPGFAVEITDGEFRATSAAVPGHVGASVLVDARLPDPSLARTLDPLLADLVRRGAVTEDVLLDADGGVLRNTGLLRVRPVDGALVDPTGAAHPHRFAVGPHTTVKAAGAFTRPGTNALSLRYNDAVARALLRSLAQPAVTVAA